jgi:hypothetical protein
MNLHVLAYNLKRVMKILGGRSTDGGNPSREHSFIRLNIGTLADPADGLRTLDEISPPLERMDTSALTTAPGPALTGSPGLSR